ncbi:MULTISPECIES: hypothetical protein [unclassified Haladaptatus]|uniref:DUF7549 family protein n=1 Tax=unclassified Haladaptatus TaxID=2622732 RepID=UPI0023E7C896|nr:MULTISPECIES: hypothetical protein [unclassified Haladaptatus]
MAWVNEDYANELAVLATWLSALMPWSFSVASLDIGTVVVIRFLFFHVQYIFGISFGEQEQILFTVLELQSFYENAQTILAQQIWLVGAFVFFLALVVSIALYLAEDTVEAGPVDPVRAIGGLLLVTGLVLTVATALLFQSFIGIAVPLGALFFLVFGATLLRVERA